MMAVDDIDKFFKELKRPDWTKVKGLMITHPIFGILCSLDQCECGSRHPNWSSLNGIPENMAPPVMMCECKMTFNQLVIDLIGSHDPAFLADVRFHFTELSSGHRWDETLLSLVPPAPESVVRLYSILHKPTKGHSH